MIIHLRGGQRIVTNMKHGDFSDLMVNNEYDFVVVPDIDNELKVFNIRKTAIDCLEVQGNSKD